MSIDTLMNFNISEDLSPNTIYITLFIGLFLNGLTNVPSSQIIYLTLGYILTKNHSVSPLISIIIGTLGNTLGNFVLYKIINKNNDFLNSKLAKYMNIDSVKLDYFMKLLKNKGDLWLILGKSVPSLKVLVPIIIGLSEIRSKKAITIFFFGSLLWAIVVTYLGFHFGKSASLIQFYIIVTCVYAVIGLWISYKINQSKK